MTALTIYCDTEFPEPAASLLQQRLAAHRLVIAKEPIGSNLVASAPDPLIEHADVVFGQPDPEAILRAPGLRWVQLTSAGYTRYNTDGFRRQAAAKALQLCSSSAVYANPCAEHLLAMMLANARALPECNTDQRARAWPSAERRQRSFLLRRQRVVILGFGAIARRLTELLAPFEAQVVALRRKPRGDEPIPIISADQLLDALRTADHVVDALPDHRTTNGLLTERHLSAMPTRAYFYNIGRGTTVDQKALLGALQSGGIAGAYLDVTDPEPLPDDHPLWTAPNCHITPHSAGGRRTEHVALVDHFLDNLDRFERDEPLVDRVL